MIFEGTYKKLTVFLEKNFVLGTSGDAEQALDVAVNAILDYQQTPEEQREAAFSNLRVELLNNNCAKAWNATGEAVHQLKELKLAKPATAGMHNTKN